MAYRHIIWDWNGTLVDDVWLCVDVVNAMLKDHALSPINADNYREFFEFPVVRYYERLGFDLSDDAFHRLSVVFTELYHARREECALHIRTREVLQGLKDAGISQSILSAYKQDLLESIVEKFGIGHYFDHLAGQDNIYAMGKIERGRALIEKIGIPRSEVVMVGDTAHDHEVAEAMGVDCLLVEHGHHTPERLKLLGRPTCKSLEDVVAALTRQKC